MSCDIRKIQSVAETERSFVSWFLGNVPSGASVRVERDLRIDVFRGLALLIIFIDHVAGNWLSRVTPSSLGMSDAAEYFVLLAGYSAALAYGVVMDRKGRLQGVAQVVARIWRLYIAHLALFVFTAVAVAVMAEKFGNPLYYEHVAILPFFQDPANAIWQTAALIFLPNYLDILPLYIVLLAMFPVLWLVAARAPALALALSLAIYLLGWQLEWALPNLSTGGVWFFNPFAWQLLFTTGLLAGHATIHGVPLLRSVWIMVVAVGILLFGLVNAAPWTAIAGFEGLAIPDLWRIDADKTNLSFWRFTHALALAYVLARLVDPRASWLTRGVFHLLGMCGRHSLPLFCLGVVLSLLGTFVLFEIGRGVNMQLFVNITGLSLLLFFARVLEWYKSMTTKTVLGAAAPRSEVLTAT